jgi:hypothetical protein
MSRAMIKVKIRRYDPVLKKMFKTPSDWIDTVSFSDLIS